MSNNTHTSSVDSVIPNSFQLTHGGTTPTHDVARPPVCTDTGCKASEWQAVLDKLCSAAQCSPSPLPVSSRSTSVDAAALKHDISQVSSHYISTGTNSASLTSSAQSLQPYSSSTPPLPPPPPPHDSLPVVQPPLSPMFSQAASLSAVHGLPPPLLAPRLSVVAERAGEADLDVATPSTTTLVPRSTLSSAVLGPHTICSEASYACTPALMPDEDAGFCLSAYGDGAAGVPAVLCTTVAAHDDCRDPLGCVDTRYQQDCSYTRTFAPPQLGSAFLDTSTASPVVNLADATALDLHHDDRAGDDGNCVGVRAAWRPSTFGAAATAFDAQERTAWQTLVEDGQMVQASPTTAAHEAATVNNNTTTAPSTACSTFYDLYHVVNRTGASNTEAVPVTGPDVSDVSAEDTTLLSSAALPFLPVTLELDKVVPDGARVDQRMMNELCSFVLEDGVPDARTSPPIGSSRGDGSTPSRSPLPPPPPPPPAMAPSTVLATASTVPTSASSLGSAPYLLVPTESPPALQMGRASANTALGVGHAVSAPSAIASATSSCVLLHPEKTANFDDHAAPKPRGVLSVQNLRAHNARLNAAKPPLATAGDTAPSSQRSSLTVASATRRPMPSYFTSTRVAAGTTIRGSEGMDDAFKKCQFLCLGDVKDAVARTCSEHTARSPLASASSASPEVSLTVDVASDGIADTPRLPAAAATTDASCDNPLSLPSRMVHEIHATTTGASTIAADAIDNGSALLLAAAFTDAHLAPSTVASRSPESATPPMLFYPHQRVFSTGTGLAGSVPDRTGSTNTTSLVALSPSLGNGLSTETDDCVSVSFSLLMSTRRDTSLGVPHLADPLEQKVCADCAAWRDDDGALDCTTQGTSPGTQNVSFSRGCFASDNVHTPVTEVGRVYSPTGIAGACYGKLSTSHGTNVSVSCPFSSVDSRPATSAPLTQAQSHVVVLDLDCHSSHSHSETNEAPDAALSTSAPPRRMYCRSFDNELADVFQLERWAKLSAHSQEDRVVFPAIPVVSVSGRRSVTEVMT